MGYPRVLVGCCALALLAYVVTARVEARPAATLARADIADAIALGETGEPAPYLLRHQGPPGNPVVVAAVYTPFVRVALLAKAAREEGRRLHPSEIAPSVTAPLVYIAFRWYCCDVPATAEDPDDLASASPQVVMLPVAERAPQYVRFTTSEREGAVKPEWVRRSTAVLETFGAKPSHDDIALVAAFPLDSLEARRPFVIYKQAKGHAGYRVGVVRADEIQAWR